MHKIAAIQMCSSQIVDENLAMAGELVAEAAKNDAELVVLPEMFAIVATDALQKMEAREVMGQGKIYSFLEALAKKYHLWIVGGTIPLAVPQQEKVRAASLVFTADGQLAARYDKIHLFDVTVSATESYKESDAIEPGNELVVVSTPVGKLGLGVCYDIRFPEMFRLLFNQGAEIFALPSAFTVKTGAAHWELLTRSRAVENFCYVIGACQGGTHSSGRKTYGHSLIVDPWGEVIAQMKGAEPGVIYATIDLQKLREIRHSIPIAQHQKIFFDTSKLDQKSGKEGD